jgi:hypothetical protein
LGTPSSYTVFRKAPGATSWGSGTVLSGNSTSFTDANVVAGSSYEYQIVKAASGYTGYGYILAGLNAALVDNRGTVVLIVDASQATPLASELTRLEQDLAGDGWVVRRHDVARTDSPVAVKNLIRADYNADPANVKSVFLFGHVPVPYSGLQDADGHPDHYGAWPADVYYGDMDGTWTDSSANYTQTQNSDPADRARLTNVPGDGKFDQTAIPSAVELAVGRVDLSAMPGRATWGGPATFRSEVELLRQYLNKDHSFRHKQINPRRRGLVGDYFGTRDGEAFAGSGFRSFAPMFGAANITNLNRTYNDTKGVWISHLAANDYLWAYGCGAGSYSTIGGLGNTGQYNDGSTVEIVNNNVRATFTFLFGSWNGDWDHEDSILRSILATPTYGLSCAWSGRPHWFTHQMALGETIGSAARLTQNNGNGGLYRNQLNSSAGNTFIALMGDPTLRLHPVAPPGSVTGTQSATSVNIGWTASSDAVLGYHVYRAPTARGPFTRLTTAPVSGNSFVDNSAVPAGSVYMVRAVKTETAGSGSYLNASQGLFWTAGDSSTGSTGGGDTTPPEIAMTSPISDTPISGSSIPVSAEVLDAVGVVGVQFKINGANLGPEILSAPFNMTWNTLSVANGAHTLTAVARDQAGNQTTAETISVVINNTTSPTNSNTLPGASTIWIEDALPQGAGPGAGGGDSWTWINAGPSPFSGSLAHQSSAGTGLHEHFFNWASATLTVNPGDVLFTYVYLDPANPPRELMFSWNANNWEHRAYWGANQISYGTDGTAGRRYQGPLPSAGQWVRLEVPASAVGLEGQTLTGMGFSLFDGRASFDATGKASASAVPPAPPTVTVTATDANAAEFGRDPGVFTISRTGSTGQALTVQQAIGGTAVGGDYSPLATTVTIPAGASSATVSVIPVDDTTSEAIETVSLTLVAGTGYTVGTPNTATVSIVDDDPATVPGPDDSGGTNSPSLLLTSFPPLALPKIGSTELHILTPQLLELHYINTKQADPARVDSWDFVDANNQLQTPAASQFSVQVNGQVVAVQSVGFKRRPAYAPNYVRDLRIENCLYLKLAAPVAENQVVEVKNPGSALWPASKQFIATNSPLRFSAAIHVNQEGYVPSFQKKAMVGGYLGSLGEMDVAASSGFKLVDANSGATVHQGSLTVRLDPGFTYAPAPYQKVLEADFSSFSTPGEYQLVVPGLGASYPFLIDEGVAMAFTRAYALGLYHQRCGTNNTLPHTRFTHDVCHAGKSDVPSPQSAFGFTWGIIAQVSADYASNPRHTAPQLKDEASQLYPFVNKGKIDVSGGHHDAGDYSKYTINSAGLAHYLTFTVDAMPGAGALDNLGLPESGNGVGDLLEMAKWETDFLAKMQDADGGFYFLVYPRDRRYEGNVTPDHGDPQVVWPKTTAVTAASVAALAQAASSPAFKQRYPNEAAAYLQKARLGWQFLMNAINRYGKDGSYQKITHYGDNYMHDDELAWAACELFIATGEPAYHQKLKEWFDPADPNTARWGWWRMSESYGNAIRSYAFAARTGRLAASQLDAGYLAKCEAQIRAAANDAVTWSDENAYAISFPAATKRMNTAGWFFASDYASDAAIGYLIDPQQRYLDIVVANMNYEGGCNPVNVSFVTGLGWKRQREVVHQYAQNDRRVLPPIGIPLGNIQAGFAYLDNYKGELRALCYPQDEAAATIFPLYDRWGDSYNVRTEFVHLNQARSVAMLAMLASKTATKAQPWTAGAAQIVAPSGVVPVGVPTTLTVQAAGFNLNGARILWEGRDQEPAFGSSFSYTPKNNGVQWVEVEIQWPDGRRVFATNTFNANSPLVVWVDDALPSGASANAGGGDSWTWTATGPSAYRGSVAHQSSASAGLHEHYFDNAKDTLDIGAGDKLFAYVYLDPSNPPSELMLMWNDGTWEHRAYWGANSISYGNSGTASRRSMGALPAAGQWARLEVPAKDVGLEGRILKGMAFSLFGGRASWDYAGKISGDGIAPAGTVPLALTKVAGGFQLTWPSVAGKSYQVRYKSKLEDAAWTPVDPAVTATSTSTSWNDTTPGLRQRFYSVTPLN